MSTIDSPAIGTATINAVSVDCPAKTNLTLHVGPNGAAVMNSTPSIARSAYTTPSPPRAKRREAASR